ncbi:MAG: M23 family metallopeptidase [Microbacteriaceae bacterium]
MTRREALAAERAAERGSHRSEHRVAKQLPPLTADAPMTLSAPPRQRAAAKPVKVARPLTPTPKRSRTLRSTLFSVVAMGFVAAVTVAVSVPAEALMTSSDVQAKQIAAAQKAASHESDQVILAGGTGQAVDGDSYTSASYSYSGATQTALTFTNNPNGTVQWPFAVGVPMSDQYGSTSGRSSAHHGQDFNPGIGAPIQSIADGVVTYVEDGEGDLGVHMMITHTINGQTITSVYAHMIHGSMRFQVGDRVKVGQVIGNVGSTGYSTGPHLHFEIRLGGIDGAWTDPLTWLRANTN